MIRCKDTTVCASPEEPGTFSQWFLNHNCPCLSSWSSEMSLCHCQLIPELGGSWFGLLNCYHVDCAGIARDSDSVLPTQSIQ